MGLRPGKLIAIEGLEGAGKSTALTVVLELLAQFNIKSMTTREPGGTEIGEELRTILKNADYKDVLDDKTELLLMYASRIQLFEQIIKPSLKKGYWIIADRFELSTMAYQGGGRGLDDKMIKQLSSFCLEGFTPDLTIYMDITPETGMQRAMKRGQFDRIEQQSIDFFHRVHLAYKQQISMLKNVFIIDANLPMEVVQQAIHTAVSHFIESNHG